MTKTDLKLLIPILLYIGFGMWASFEFAYIESHKALLLVFKWAIVPSIIIGFYYSYYSLFKHGADQALWRKILGMVGLTIIFTLLLLRSSQGYLIFCNAHIGNQKEIVLKGEIKKLDFPKRKKLLNSYTIYIYNRSINENVRLDVPTNNYEIGQIFEMKMIEGSLGVLYSKK